jgi:hypothetical protein
MRRHQRRSDRAPYSVGRCQPCFPPAGRPVILLCRLSNMGECHFDKLRSRYRRERFTVNENSTGQQYRFRRSRVTAF